jgi:hypothetical protein
MQHAQKLVPVRGGSMTHDLLQAALDYARRGWAVFPLHTAMNGRCSYGKPACGDIGKHPRFHQVDLAHGLLNATTVEAQIRRWWRRWPQANIGIPTGAQTFVAVDLDPRNGSVVGLEQLEAEGYTLPDTVESMTGAGGRHLCYQHPGVNVRNSTGKDGKGLAPGVDVKGDGGYIVAPPSMHSSGQRYAWEASSHPDDLPLATLPTWVIARVHESGAHSNGHHTDGDIIGEGQRNGMLTSLGGTMRRRGMTAEEILAALRAVNISLCRPSLDDADVVKIATSVGRYAPGERHHSEEGDAPDKSTTPPWPVLDAAALHGLAGDIVETIAPHTETDPVALLVQTLLFFGNVVGRGPHCQVEADRYALNEFGVLVGTTAKARKGTSEGHIRRLYQRVDPTWTDTRIEGGLSSGEGLIWAVRDAVERNGEIVEPGVTDKRLLVIEAEFASTLRVLGRDGNTLSAIIRHAWDGRRLSALTKNSPAHATGAHISFIGHITRDELLRYLGSTEVGNGFGNRFLWLCVRRSNILPEGGELKESALTSLVMRLRRAVDAAIKGHAITRDDVARAMWREVYPELSEGKPGLLGAMTSRAEAHVMRLSGIYALLDESPVVTPVHLQAALASWQYCEDSARFIFGEALGDPLADEILYALRTHREGMTRTELSNYFDRHKSTAQINQVLKLLTEQRLASCEKQATGGRAREVWKFRTAKKAN